MTPDEFNAGMEKIYPNADWQSVYRPSDDQEAYRMRLRSQSDYDFQKYLVSAGLAKTANARLNLYAYYFDNAPPGWDAAFYGSFHSSDLWYFFASLRDLPGQRKWTSADYRMADAISSYLANFIRTGNPNGPGMPKWRQVGRTQDKAFMRFADGYAYSVDSTPYLERDLLNREQIVHDAKAPN